MTAVRRVPCTISLAFVRTPVHDPRMHKGTWQVPKRGDVVLTIAYDGWCGTNESRRSVVGYDYVEEGDEERVLEEDAWGLDAFVEGHAQSSQVFRSDGLAFVIGRAVEVCRLPSHTVWMYEGKLLVGCQAFSAKRTFKALAKALGYEVTG